MSTYESNYTASTRRVAAASAPRRGTPTSGESSAAGKSGGAKKLDANLLDALWDQVIAMNRAAGPWGVCSRSLP